VTIKVFLEYSIFQRNYFFEMSKFKEIIRERKIQKLMETKELLA
jgi:hypothetical protein